MWEDIAPSDMEQGQMGVKNVSWLIWKEHALLWENIWAGALFCQTEDKNPKLSRPSSDVCHSYTTLSLEAKNVFEIHCKIKDILCMYMSSLLGCVQLYQV